MIDSIFKDPDFVSNTLKINSALVNNFVEVSGMVNSKTTIDTKKYKETCLEIMRTLLDKYKF